MARQKKTQIKVDLDLPKDDTTMAKLYTIIGISLLLGISSLGFWIINTDFIPTQNGQPMFINMYCKFDPRFQTTYSDNQSCDILQDTPSPTTWESGDPWRGVGARGQDFDVPGLDDDTLGTYPRSLMPQQMTVSCEVRDTKPVPFTVEIRDPDGYLLTWHDKSLKHYSNATNTAKAQGGGCDLVIPDVQPGEGYTIAFISNDESETLDSVAFSISIDVYDGIPDNMNNKSLWIGPEIKPLGISLRPIIFLNWFGFGIFIIIYPASVFWEKQMKALNEVEEKFPDFLRDLAEYWKGGLSMTVAVQTLANSEYGALNDDVKKMANQISWGIAFEVVIHQFAERVGTPLVKRAISLITEANRAGGKISDILVTAANDSREIKFLEGERARVISSYIAVIWVSYMVFLLVIIMMGKIFIPAIAGSNAGDSDDEGGASIGNMQIRSIDALFFITVFYYGVTMQALGNGTMAGLMATGRVTAGFKIAGQMIIVGLLGFNFIVYEPQLIGLSPPPGLNPATGTYTPGPAYIP